MDIALITVTYNGGDSSLRWADAIARAWARRPEPGPAALRVIAVDNASPDGTAARLAAHAPDVEVLPQAVNRGFAAGCNVGIEAAGDADLLVVINPDVEVDEDFFTQLHWLELTADVAAVGPLVIGHGAEVEQSARAFPGAATGLWGRTTLLTRLFPSAARGRELLADPAKGRRDVDWISGACMIIPAAAQRAVGPFDEGYFMYWEDADWCRRAHDRGLRVVYDPSLRVSHAQGSSSVARPVKTIIEFHRSAFRYYRLHGSRNPLGVAAAGLALTVRCALKLLLSRR